MTDESRWAARRERGRRFVQAGAELASYPALSDEEETEATLAAAPPEKTDHKPKVGQEPPA